MLDYEIALFLSMIALIIFLIYAMKSKMKFKDIGTRFILLVYLCGIITLTVFPIYYKMKVYYPEGVNWYNLIPFYTIKEIFIFGPTSLSGAQIIGNILLTVPYGVLIMIILKEKNWWKLLLLALVLTVSIELIQLFIGLSINNMYRTIDIDDVILNTMGAYLGYSLYMLYQYYINSKRMKRNRYEN